MIAENPEAKNRLLLWLDLAVLQAGLLSAFPRKIKGEEWQPFSAVELGPSLIYTTHGKRKSWYESCLK
jgi:hypothetical protein